MDALTVGQMISHSLTCSGSAQRYVAPSTAQNRTGRGPLKAPSSRSRSWQSREPANWRRAMVFRTDVGAVRNCGRPLFGAPLLFGMCLIGFDTGPNKVCFTFSELVLARSAVRAVVLISSCSMKANNSTALNLDLSMCNGVFTAPKCQLWSTKEISGRDFKPTRPHIYISIGLYTPLG